MEGFPAFLGTTLRCGCRRAFNRKSCLGRDLAAAIILLSPGLGLYEACAAVVLRGVTSKAAVGAIPAGAGSASLSRESALANNLAALTPPVLSRLSVSHLAVAGPALPIAPVSGLMPVAHPLPALPQSERATKAQPASPNAAAAKTTASGVGGVAAATADESDPRLGVITTQLQQAISVDRNAIGGQLDLLYDKAKRLASQTETNATQSLAFNPQTVPAALREKQAESARQATALPAPSPGQPALRKSPFDRTVPLSIQAFFGYDAPAVFIFLVIPHLFQGTLVFPEAMMGVVIAVSSFFWFKRLYVFPYLSPEKKTAFVADFDRLRKTMVALLVVGGAAALMNGWLFHPAGGFWRVPYNPISILSILELTNHFLFQLVPYNRTDLKRPYRKSWLGGTVGRQLRKLSLQAQPAS